jgi:hypothetical protein
MYDKYHFLGLIALAVFGELQTRSASMCTSFAKIDEFSQPYKTMGGIRCGFKYI